MVIKGVTELLISLTLCSPPIDHNGMGFRAVLLLELTNVDLTTVVFFDRLKGFFDELFSLGCKCTPDRRKELRVRDATIFILVENVEDFLDIDLSHIHLQSKNRGLEFIEVELPGLISVDTVEVAL
jgi:hypothetical protein